MRKRLANGFILIVCPLTIGGLAYFAKGRYMLAATLLALYVVAVFFLMFERRKPRVREVVLTASLCAIGVAGRAAFFFLPQVKPVAALAILAGMVFGPHTGFIVGAMTGLLSNFLFGQGPWTAYQMFAFGLIGFFAAYLPAKKTWAVCAYGGAAVLVLYGAILNLQSYLFLARGWNAPLFFATWAAGLPFDLVHAASTVVFLAICTRPFLQKAGRVQKKYGFMEENVVS